MATIRLDRDIPLCLSVLTGLQRSWLKNCLALMLNQRTPAHFYLIMTLEPLP
ncbi:hypothetical protein BRARA_F03588 [Brassica rapa]|uniref:Uncharacterized protein n=1 Tax=Brassica campestris TaxID=3711 RepID=A0A397Z407_BRACM|nr:hypothetical protein BRARA_F03588 [Brassica rapa]